MMAVQEVVAHHLDEIYGFLMDYLVENYLPFWSDAG
jgi:hypothetical protein